MSIFKEIAVATKKQAQAVLKAAQERIEALDKEKKDAIRELDNACMDKRKIRFYGQDCYVVGASLYATGFGQGRWEFTLDNDSKIVIYVD